MVSIRPGAEDRLATIVRIPTMNRAAASLDPLADVSALAEQDAAAFARLRETMRSLWPSAFAALEVELVAERTILARWRGSSSLSPTLLMAHQDVVVADDDGWQHAPFAAVIVGGTLHGRGAIEDKASLAGLLEAGDALAAAGHVPEYDVWLLFGHDEETRGAGASAAVAELAQRGVRPALVLDEGGAIIDSPVPGVRRPVAVIGVSEKGITTVRISVTQHGGHASTPPRTSASVRLAQAITRINRYRFPRRLNPTAIAMLERLGAVASGPAAGLLRRAKTARPLLELVLARDDETRAMLQTTAVVTMLAGGTAPNAVPERVSALLNVRIANGSSVAELRTQLRKAVNDDRVVIEIVEANEPSPTSPVDTEPWFAIADAVAALDPSIVVVPYDMLGATDARHATRISSAVYRFAPFRLSRSERDRLHAKNESIEVAAYLEGCAWYLEFIRQR